MPTGTSPFALVLVFAGISTKTGRWEIQAGRVGLAWLLVAGAGVLATFPIEI